MDPIAGRVEFTDTPPSPRGIWGHLDELVTDLVDTRQKIAALQAHESVLLADAVDVVIAREQDRHDRDLPISHKLPLREISAELAAAMRLSDRTVQTRMGDAALLVHQFPATHTALTRGDIDLAHARTIIEAGSFITDPDKRAHYERRALLAADSETPHRLKSIVNILAARIDPDAAKEHIEHSKQDRSVRLIDLPHNRGQVIYEGPALLARAIYDRLTSMAHTLTKTTRTSTDDGTTVADTATTDTDTGTGTPAVPDAPADDESGSDVVSVVTGPSPDADPEVEDPRTMDQKRADILADILLTGAPTAHGDALDNITAKVQITIPALTLLGQSKQPPILAGHGPIDLDTAKRLAAHAPGWDRVLTHPSTGEPVAVDRYRPSAELRRFLDIRDQHCRFPGCTRPPWNCDNDHTIDAALGGPTSDDNLGDECRPHHVVKHNTLWKVEQIGHGRLLWTSPTGRQYIDTPITTLTFIPEPLPTDEPAPF